MLIGSAQARTTTPSGPTNSTDWLDTFEEQLDQWNGQIVTFRVAGLRKTGFFYAPFGLFWTLDETGNTQTEVNSLSRSKDHLYLERDGVILLHQPAALDHEIELVDPTQHPLADFPCPLPSQPLAIRLAGQRTGSRSDAAGIVNQPHIEVWTHWHSLSDHSVISHTDGQSETLHWRDVNFALKGHNE